MTRKATTHSEADRYAPTRGVWNFQEASEPVTEHHNGTADDRIAALERRLADQEARVTELQRDSELSAAFVDFGVLGLIVFQPVADYAALSTDDVVN